MQFLLFLGKCCNLYKGKRCWVSTKVWFMLPFLFWLILCTLKSVWVDLFVLRFNIKWPTALINKVLSKESGLEDVSTVLLEDNNWANAPLHNRLRRFWSMFFGRLGFLFDLFWKVTSMWLSWDSNLRSRDRQTDALPLRYWGWSCWKTFEFLFITWLISLYLTHGELLNGISIDVGKMLSQQLKGFLGWALSNHLGHFLISHVCPRNIGELLYNIWLSPQSSISEWI